MEKRRNSSVEILRMISVICITIHHAVLHSNIMEMEFGLARCIAQFLILLGKAGVNIFVLITGYYLGSMSIDGKSTMNRAVKFYSSVFYYAFLMGTVCLLLRIQPLTIKAVLKSVFPIITKSYWFATAFMGLIVLSPFLNQVLLRFERKQLLTLTGILLIMFCFSPIDTWVNDLLWFSFVYISGALIHIYKDELSHKRPIVYFVVSFCGFILMWLFSIVLSLLSVRIPSLSSHINYLSSKQNLLFMFVSSLGIFMGVVVSKERYSPIINFMAKHALSCYLIQSNFLFSPFLWEKVSSIRPDSQLLYLPYILIISICIFIASITIDIFSEKIYGRLGELIISLLQNACNWKALRRIMNNGKGI